MTFTTSRQGGVHITDSSILPTGNSIYRYWQYKHPARSLNKMTFMPARNKEAGAGKNVINGFQVTEFYPINPLVIGDVILLHHRNPSGVQYRVGP
jgi:hypothetical protein